MMCPFFKTDAVTRESREIGSSRHAQQIETCWCEHPHSPVSKGEAWSLGGGNRLKCKGEFPDKCQVPPDKQGDI